MPTNAAIRLEVARSGGGAYDRMLHVYGRTSRTIAFRKQPGGGFKWIAEQEIYEGPKEYTSVDGTFHENLCFTYELQRVAHYRLNELNISYTGEDVRLVQKGAIWQDDLRLDRVLPILRDWGYDVEPSAGGNAR